jgi:hypothetical protein
VADTESAIVIIHNSRSPERCNANSSFRSRNCCVFSSVSAQKFNELLDLDKVNEFTPQRVWYQARSAILASLVPQRSRETPIKEYPTIPRSQLMIFDPQACRELDG